MTKDEAVVIVGYLNAAYPANKMDDSSAVVYVAFLQDLDFECCRYAVKQWIRREKWFPTVADIASATKAEMRRLNPEGVVRAIEQGRTLTREENLARLAEIQAQIKKSTGPLFNPRTRQAALGSAAEVQPAPPAPRSRSGRSSSSPEEHQEHQDPQPPSQR